jgi:plastocyanin
MAVHTIKINKGAFEPRSLNVKRGDKIQFQLMDRDDPAQVKVAGELFEDENQFEVGSSSKEKAIRGTSGFTTYRLTTNLSLAYNEDPALAREQSGTVNGTITVIP